MPRVVIDEIGVVAELETAPLFRGLELADDAIERFRVNSKVAVVLDARLDTAGLEASIDALDTGTKPSLDIPVRLVGGDEVKRQAEQITQSISPAAFEAFSQATTQSFEQIAQSLNGLNTTLAQITGGVEGFFQGAAEELQRLALTSATTAQSQTDLAQRSLQAADGFRAAGVAESEMNAELQRTGFLSEQAAAALLKVAEARRQGALASGAGAGAAAALAVPTGFDKLISDQQRARAGAVALSEGFALASRQAKVLADANQAAATGSGRVAAGFALAAEQVRAVAVAENELAASSSRAAQGFGTAGAGGSRLLNTLSGIAVGAIGAGGKIGTLASNLFTFAASAAAGGVAGAAIVGVSAAIALAYEKLTEATRKAREEQEKLNQQLDQMRLAQSGPVAVAQGQFDAQLKEVRRLQQAFADLRAEQDRARQATTPLELPAFDARALAQQKDASDELTLATQRLAAAQRALGDAEREQHGVALLQSLGQERDAFGLTAIEARKLAISLDEDLTPAQRQAAQAILDQIAALERQRDAAEKLKKALAEIAGNVNGQLQSTPRVEIGVALKPVIDTADLQQAVDRVVATLKQAKLDDSIQAELDRAAKAAKDLDGLLEQIDLTLKDIGNANITGPAAAAAQLVEGLLTTGRGINDIAHAFDFATQSLHIFGEDGSRILQNLGNLAEDATNAIAGIVSGNPFQAISGILNSIGDIGGIFGGSESEHDRVVRENTSAIRENTARQNDAFRGAGGQLDLAQRVETALERFRAATEARTAAIEGLVKQGVDRTVAGGEVGAAPILTKFLQDTGLSLEDLQRVADELVPGLQLVDKNGHLVADALAQLDKAVEASIKAQFRFSNSFDDQLRRTALESRLIIGREQSPSEKFNQEVLAAGAAGASVIRDAFKGINLSDGVSPEEADKVREALKGLLLAFENGTLDLSKLGSLSADDLLKLLEDGADFLDTFNKEVQKATLAQVQSQETLRAHLFGTGTFDASAAFQAQVAGLAKVAPDFAKQFESLGAFGPEDQAAVRAILQQGFKNLIAGIIPEGLTAEEFQQFLEQGASFLDSFNDGLKGATDRLNDLNIPEGFRRAALAFQTGDRGPDTGTTPTRTDEGGQVTRFNADLLKAVQDIRRPTDGAALPDFAALTTAIRPVGDTLPRLTDVLDAQDDTLAKLVALLEGKADAAGGGAVPGASRAPEIHLTIAAGAIVVHAAPGQSASEIAGGVLTEFRRLAMLQTGDTLDTGSFT